MNILIMSPKHINFAVIMISTVLRQPGPFKLNDCEGDGWRQGWLDWEQVSLGFLET